MNTQEERILELEQKVDLLNGLLDIIREHQTTHCKQIHTTLDLLVAVLEEKKIPIPEKFLEIIENAQKN